MALEGFVIVASILFAFAIDAWWDERNDNIESIQQLDRVSAELHLNSDMLSSKIDTLRASIEATYELLSWMGPQPDAVEADVFVDQMNLVTNIGTFSQVRRAVNDYLADARITTIRSKDIRKHLSEWDYHSDRFANQYGILRTQHWTLLNYRNMKAYTPALKIFSSHPDMPKHPDTKFPFDQSAFLADPIVENLLATYLIRLEIVYSMALLQLERQAKLLELIDAVR